MEQENGVDSLTRLLETVRRLLGPDGCAWDREQTPQSLRPFLLEEVYEVIDAIDAGDVDALREELGDLFLHIIFQVELTAKEHPFTLREVIDGLIDKLIRRHPHVFHQARAIESAEALSQWEAIKMREKPERHRLDRIPRTFPALVRSHKIVEIVARLGFDWSHWKDAYHKVMEEFQELQEAIQYQNQEAIEEEMGDLLFSLVHLCRALSLNAESVLQRSNHKFISRFKKMEMFIQKEHGQERGTLDPSSPRPIEFFEKYWNQVKSSEKE
ncbi:nucleoside triphosphate pyrophosphohydrolase [Pajaroellobacter abortibovis]|uniref:Nucleoside triphosphate pyrophosphohydrolase n=1 Tax=Pajaroellobacter abortibovis TaxID=1882918 RepID=A0A1L6MZJ1_9BACT|nr:nucleoside triphosphate pyrophosphohydrolase [Pajaroellobacter abortibovis]